MGEIFLRYKNINYFFVTISTLVKSDIGEKLLINFLINIPAQSLKNYLECANIHQKKPDLIEMIVYGYITDKLNNIGIEDM